MADDEDLDDLFVEDLPDYLRCSICLSCLQNPYQTPCGHRFCKDCIIPVMNSPQNLCPQDRTIIDATNTYPDNAVRLQINRLKIKCPKQGCDWVGELSDKPNHLQKCKFIKQPCDLCGHEVLKAYMDLHVTSCPNRKIKCEYCGDDVPQSEINLHHLECPLFLIPCPHGCSEDKLPRKGLESHTATICPKVLIACSFAPFGCSEMVTRGSMAEHVRTCGPQRCAGMAATILDLQKELKDLRLTVSKQADVVKELETSVYPSSGQFTWRIDDIRAKITQAQAGDQTSSVIYSPAFYSTESGYRLSLCIYPAGDNNQGYLSLYFVIVKGQFDEVLQWPFQKRVYLTLLNTKGGHGVMKNIEPDPRLHYFHRPESLRNVGYGYPKFIQLTRLLHEDSDFVAGGAIFLRSRVLDRQ